jgi:hypothetical protein
LTKIFAAKGGLRNTSEVRVTVLTKTNFTNTSKCGRPPLRCLLAQCHMCRQVDALKAEVDEAIIEAGRGTSHVLPKNVKRVKRLAEMQRTADEDAELDTLTGKLERVLEVEEVAAESVAAVSGHASRAYSLHHGGGSLNVSQVDAVKEAIARRLQASSVWQPKAFTNPLSAPASSSKLPSEAQGAEGEGPLVSDEGAQQWPAPPLTSRGREGGKGAGRPAGTSELDREQRTKTALDTRHPLAPAGSPEQSPEERFEVGVLPRASSPSTPTDMVEGAGQLEVQQQVQQQVQVADDDLAGDPVTFTDMFQDSSWQLMVALLGTVGVVGAVCRLRPRLARWFVRIY